jgi:hypothetical protein
VAGLSPTRSDLNIPIQELLQNVEDMWIRLGRQPTYNDMNSPDSRVSAATYANRFGSWRAALQTFVETVAREPESDTPRNGETLTAPLQSGRNRTVNHRIRFRSSKETISVVSRAGDRQRRTQGSNCILITHCPGRDPARTLCPTFKRSARCATWASRIGNFQNCEGLLASHWVRWLRYHFQ